MLRLILVVLLKLLLVQELLPDLNLLILDGLLENIIAVEHLFVVSLAVGSERSLRIGVLGVPCAFPGIVLDLDINLVVSLGQLY